MKRFASIALTFLAAFPAFGDDTFRSLVERIQGEYRILMAGGKMPKPEVASGEIVAEDKKAEFNFPYCPEGSDLCEAGYRTFKWQETELEAVKNVEGAKVYTFTSTTARGKRRFQWIERKDSAPVFRDINHRFGSAPEQPVDFELDKQ